MLLLKLALLLVKLLLLEVLNLGINGRDAIRRRGREHVRGNRRVADRGGHGGRVVLQQAVASGNHVGGDVAVGHHGIGGLPRLRHHGLAVRGVGGMMRGMRAVGGRVLEALKVELHVAVGHVAHAAHVEKLIELVVGTSRHVLVLGVPGSGTHGGRVRVSGCSRCMCAGAYAYAYANACARVLWRGASGCWALRKASRLCKDERRGGERRGRAFGLASATMNASSLW